MLGDGNNKGLLNGCCESKEGVGVGRPSFTFDFGDFVENEERNEPLRFDDVGDGSVFDGDGRCTMELKEVDELFSSILIVVLEFERSMGIEGGSVFVSFE